MALDRPAWERFIEDLVERIKAVFAAAQPAIIENAEENPETLLEPTEVQNEEVIDAYQTAVDDTIESTVEDINDFTDEDEPDRVEPATKESALAVGGFFVSEVLRRAFFSFTPRLWPGRCRT